MRWMLCVVLAGCASPSTADELRDLQARAGFCGAITDACDVGTPTQVVVDCLNRAFQAGSLSQAHWGDYDTKMYEWRYDVFTDHGKLRVFHTEPDDFGGDPTVTEEQSCTGPVTVSTTTICGSTHPLIDAPGCSFPTN